jgi:hypothetical protein
MPDLPPEWQARGHCTQRLVDSDNLAKPPTHAVKFVVSSDVTSGLAEAYSVGIHLFTPTVLGCALGGSRACMDPDGPSALIDMRMIASRGILFSHFGSRRSTFSSLKSTSEVRLIR